MHRIIRQFRCKNDTQIETKPVFSAYQSACMFKT